MCWLFWLSEGNTSSASKLKECYIAWDSILFGRAAQYAFTDNNNAHDEAAQDEVYVRF